jgi:hypothetical protein
MAPEPPRTPCALRVRETLLSGPAARWTLHCLDDPAGARVLRAAPAGNEGDGEVVPASVPGCVFTDLRDRLPDPMMRDYALLPVFDRLEHATFQYCCEFDGQMDEGGSGDAGTGMGRGGGEGVKTRIGPTAESEDSDGAVAGPAKDTAGPPLSSPPYPETRIVFDGLDPVADVVLNGAHLLSAANAFHPHSALLPLGALRNKDGKNELRVTFPAPRACLERRAAEHPYREWNDPVGGISRLRTPQYSAGWDWGPRLLGAGITGEVRIRRTPVARIDDVAVLQAHHEAPTDSNRVDGTAVPAVTLRFLVEAAVKPDWRDRVRCVATVGDDGMPPREARLAPTDYAAQEEARDGGGAGISGLTPAIYEGVLTIDKPRLWWPNGYGEQHLYRVTVVCRLDGEPGLDVELDSRSFRVGLRCVKLVRGSTPGLAMCKAGEPGGYSHALKMDQSKVGESGCDRGNVGPDHAAGGDAEMERRGIPEKVASGADAEQSKNELDELEAEEHEAEEREAEEHEGEKHEVDGGRVPTTTDDSEESASPMAGNKIPQVDKDESFTFVVNGRKIFAKGANFIPTQAVFSQSRSADYDHVIAAAAAANMNMLRLWGGGSYEKDEFYDRCDEYGILVWHDFMFSCSLYPGDSEFLASCREEARHQVARLRNRACMALWCGMSSVECY